MTYPLTRGALATCLNRLKDESQETVLTDPEFMFYHKNRNYFNTLNKEGERLKITELKQIGMTTYMDNHNNKWTEILIGVIYHRPFSTNGEKADYCKDFIKAKKDRYCRKFICPDPFIDLNIYNGGCEFELILRAGTRQVSDQYMETYNFGITGAKSTAIGLHGKFDVSPHKKSPDYVTNHYNSHQIAVSDSYEFIKKYPKHFMNYFRESSD